MHILEKLFSRVKIKDFQKVLLVLPLSAPFNWQSLLAEGYSHLGESYSSISLLYLAELWLTKSHSNLDKTNFDTFEKEVQLYSIFPAVDHGPGGHAVTSH